MPAPPHTNPDRPSDIPNSADLGDPPSSAPPEIRASFGARTPGITLWLVLALWAAILALRVIGPSDLLDNDQLGPAAYANDALINANWIVQTDVQGDIASKPPLTTWLIALFSLPLGHATPLTLLLPSALAVLGCALLTLHFGARHLGRLAGAAAALALLLCPMGAKQITLVRTDAVYALVVGVATLLAWRAWRTSARTWILFWIAAGVVTLTKGPVGLLVPAGAMLAAIWERRTSNTQGPARSRVGLLACHAVGIVLFLTLTGGWFALAWSTAGDAFIAKILGDELVGKAAHSGSGALPFTTFYLPPLYYLSRFAPASIFTFLALWNAWKHPAPDPETRALQRFLAMGFVVPMLAFCIAPHQRADHLTPLWIPGALLAGRELAIIAASLSTRTRAVAASAWILGALAAIATQYVVLAQRRDDAVRIRAIQQLAARIEAIPDRPPILHVNDNSSLQLFLHTMSHRVSAQAAADALAGDAPVLVAASTKPSDLDEELAARALRPGVVASWSDDSGWGVRILANEPAMEAVAR